VVEGAEGLDDDLVDEVLAMRLFIFGAFLGAFLDGVELADVLHSREVRVLLEVHALGF